MVINKPAVMNNFDDLTKPQMKINAKEARRERRKYKKEAKVTTNRAILERLAYELGEIETKIQENIKQGEKKPVEHVIKTWDYDFLEKELTKEGFKVWSSDAPGAFSLYPLIKINIEF